MSKKLLCTPPTPPLRKRSSLKVELLERPDGWGWHLRAANGRIICQGEGHPTVGKAKRAARTVLVTAVAALLGPEVAAQAAKGWRHARIFD